MVEDSKKLPRTNLEEKLMIIDYFKKSNKPQSETVEHFKDKFSISTSSFSEWLRHENELRERYIQANNESNGLSENIKHSKRKSTFKYGPINEAMHKVVNERMKMGLPITEPILRHYWSKYAKEYGVTDPKRAVCFSHGWLANFKKRHGLIKMRKSKSEGNNNPPKHNKEFGTLMIPSSLDTTETDINNEVEMKITEDNKDKFKSENESNNAIVSSVSNNSLTYKTITIPSNTINRNYQEHQQNSSISHEYHCKCHHHYHHHKNCIHYKKKRKIPRMNNIDYSNCPPYSYNNYDIQSQMQLSQFIDNNNNNTNISINPSISDKTMGKKNDKSFNSKILNSILIPHENLNEHENKIDKIEVFSPSSNNNNSITNNRPRIDLDLPPSGNFSNIGNGYNHHSSNFNSQFDIQQLLNTQISKPVLSGMNLESTKQDKIKDNIDNNNKNNIAQIGNNRNNNNNSNDNTDLMSNENNNNNNNIYTINTQWNAFKGSIKKPVGTSNSNAEYNGVNNQLILPNIISQRNTEMRSINNSKLGKTLEISDILDKPDSINNRGNFQISSLSEINTCDTKEKMSNETQNSNNSSGNSNKDKDDNNNEMDKNNLNDRETNNENRLNESISFGIIRDDMDITVEDMERLLFVYADKFFKKFKGTQRFEKSKELFDEFKTSFMADKHRIELVNENNRKDFEKEFYGNKKFL